MNRLTKTGVVGSVLMAICCFTPLTAWLLAGIGLGFAMPFVESVALPMMVVFAGMAA